jgi:trigger factor
MPLATVKGFRKGLLKILLKKQYGKTIKVEEVTKVVDLAFRAFYNQKD